jgi:hypothetical protein
MILRSQRSFELLPKGRKLLFMSADFSSQFRLLRPRGGMPSAVEGFVENASGRRVPHALQPRALPTEKVHVARFFRARLARQHSGQRRFALAEAVKRGARLPELQTDTCARCGRGVRPEFAPRAATSTHRTAISRRSKLKTSCRRARTWSPGYRRRWPGRPGVFPATIPERRAPVSSSSAITGSRLFFWLQAFTSAFSDRG